MTFRGAFLRSFLGIGMLTGLAVVAKVVDAVVGQPAEEKTIRVDDRQRRYLILVPSGLKQPAPVVLALHGGRGNARQMERYSRFDALAEKEGFVVVYPEALYGNWNDGRGAEAIRSQRENIDDVKYLRAVVDDVAAQLPIDRTRVFATGISNGAFMSHRLAAEASDVVAAVAPVVGGMPPAIADAFNPRFPVSVLIIQGDADPLIPIDGGLVAEPFGRRRGVMLAAADTLAKYVQRNGNPGDPAVTTVDAHPKDGTAVEIRRYPDGPGGVKTEYYLVQGGGHNWPGRPLYLPERVIGKASQEFSATDVIWHFFQSCPPRAK